MTDPETEPRHGLGQDSTWQGPVLQGSRVRIEPIGAERARALLAGRPEPELAWEDGFPLAPLLASLQRVIDDPDGPVKFGSFYAYVIIRRGDGLAVGDAGFYGPPGADGEVEIGYALAPRARGSGLASETVALLAGWALSQPGVRALSARVEPDNAASVRLLAGRAFKPFGLADASSLTVGFRPVAGLPHRGPCTATTPHIEPAAIPAPQNIRTSPVIGGGSAGGASRGTSRRFVARESYVRAPGGVQCTFRGLLARESYAVTRRDQARLTRAPSANVTVPASLTEEVRRKCDVCVPWRSSS